MSGVFRFEGAIGAVLGGLFLAAGHALDYLAGQPTGTTTGKSFVLAGHVALIFAFVGLYAHQRRTDPAPIGRGGAILGVVGTTLVSAIVFVEVAGTTGVDTTPVFEAAGTSVPYTVGPLLFVLGMVLVGGSIARRDDLPRTAGGLLVLGTGVFAAASAVTATAAALTLLGGAITASGFVWLGIALFRTDERRASVGGL